MKGSNSDVHYSFLLHIRVHTREGVRARGTALWRCNQLIQLNSMLIGFEAIIYIYIYIVIATQLIRLPIITVWLSEMSELKSLGATSGQKNPIVRYCTYMYESQTETS